MNNGEAMSPELKLVEFYQKDENSLMFPGKQGEGIVCDKDGEKILE